MDAKSAGYSFRYSLDFPDMGHCIIINNKNFDRRTGYLFIYLKWNCQAPHDIWQIFPPCSHVWLVALSTLPRRHLWDFLLLSAKMGLGCDHSCEKYHESFMTSMNCMKKHVVQPERAALCACDSAWVVFEESIYTFAVVDTVTCQLEA